MAATLGPFSSRHLRYRIPIYVKQQVIGILFYWWKKVSSTSRWIADFFALVSCVCPPYCVSIYQLELYWIAYWKLSREPPLPPLFIRQDRQCVRLYELCKNKQNTLENAGEKISFTVHPCINVGFSTMYIATDILECILLLFCFA